MGIEANFSSTKMSKDSVLAKLLDLMRGFRFRERALQRWPNFFEMDKIIFLNICNLVTNSRFVPIHMLFKAIWTKRDLGAKTVFFASEMHYSVVYIAHTVHILSGIYCIYIVPN